MKAIFVSAIDYEAPVQIGDHQIARQFAAHGWQVAFLSTPITVFHALSKNSQSIARRYQNYRMGGKTIQVGSGSIWSYVPGAFLLPKNNRILNRSFIYDHWHKATLPNLKGMLRKHGFDQVSLVYIRDPLQGFLLDLVQHQSSVFRIADNDFGFTSYNENYARLTRKTAQTVDVVLYTARELESFVRDLAPRRSIYFPNGVDFNHFNQAELPMPSEYRSFHRPIAVYAGSIDFWFDFALVNQLTSQLPEIDFVIIGENQRFRDQFVPRDNLHLLGAVKHALLPGYLAHARVGIIPFNVADHPRLVNAISPIKLLEYMASGLPVAASSWNELRALQSPAVLCFDTAEFTAAIRQAVAAPPDRDNLRDFARQHDWSNHYQQLLQILQETNVHGQVGS